MESTQNLSQIETDNPQEVGTTDATQNNSNLQPQSTQENINDQKSQNLSVQQTGDPLNEQAMVYSPSNSNIFLWVLGVGVIIVSIWLIVKLIKESTDEIEDTSVATPAIAVKSKQAKKTVKKKSTKKKSAPNQRRKKSATRKH